MTLKHFTLLITFLICSLSLNAQSKVGTVNINDILLKLPELTEVNSLIKMYRDDLEKTLNDKVTTYKTKLENYKSNESSYSDMMKKTLGEELYELEQDITSFQQNGGKLTKYKQDELLRPLYQKINTTIASVAKAGGYTQILTVTGNQFAYFDANFDITIAVITALGLSTEK